MFRLEDLASIFQNMTFNAYVQRLANVTKIAKFNLPSIFTDLFVNICCLLMQSEEHHYFSFKDKLTLEWVRVTSC